MDRRSIAQFLPVLLMAPASLPAGAPRRHPGPAILYFTPQHGPVGTQVSVLGWGFTGTRAVTLGGTAAPFHTQNDWVLTFTVPPGAATGPVAITTQAGTGVSSGRFTVDGAPPQPQAPAVAGFTPTQGPAGTGVTVTGSGFVQGAQVAFGGVAAAAVQVASATRLQATVPAGARTGPVTVTTAAGTGTSAAAFTVLPSAGAPAVTSFSPLQGPAGTSVTVTGSGFTAGAQVAFNGVAAASVSVSSATQLQAVVPAAATSGPISVTTAAGTGVSAAAFTVQGGTPPPSTGVNLGFGGWYLTQSVQTLDRAVPLVAGRDGLLRVFVTASGANQAAPAVRVTVTGGSPSPWVQTVAAPGGAVPTSVDESSLAASWNLRIPGAVLAASATLKLELDPDQRVPDRDRGDNVLTAGLAAQAVKPFRTTVIPVTQQGLTGNVTGGRTLASWADRLQRMYPLAGVDVQLGAGYTTQANLNSGSDGWSQLLGELDRKRAAEGSGRYYFGAVNVSYSGGIAGLGYIGQPTAIGWDKGGYADGGNYPEVLAHETGHNFGRQHAPCGGVSGTDPSWPSDPAHSNARIGVYGWDPGTGGLVAPTLNDVMAYCHPIWVSDYTYKSILSFRASSWNGLDEPARPARRRCLLVSGRIKDGAMTLDPAFALTTVPAYPEGEEYLLELADADGAALVRFPFTPAQVADLRGHEERHFSYALPVEPAVERAVRSVKVLTPRGVLAMREGGWSAPPKPPAAKALGDGKVRLTWEPQDDGTAMVRDARTLEVLSFARGGSADLETKADKVLVDLSNGVSSTAFEVEVEP